MRASTYSDKNFSALSPSSISGLQCSIVSDESCVSGDSFRSKDHVQDFFRTRKALNLEGSIEGLFCRSIEPPLAFDGRFGRMFWGFDRRLPSVKSRTLDRTRLGGSIRLVGCAA